MKNKRILITGGAGFIGSHLADILVSQNSVVVLDNLSSGKKENLDFFRKNGGHFIKGDVLKKSDVQRAIENIDIVFHLAVQCVRLSFINPYVVHEVNAAGTLNVLEACRKAQVKRFIYVSSSEVYGTAIKVPMTETHPTGPTTIYGASKLAGEYYSFAYWRTYGLSLAVVRPFNTYGPRAHFEGVYGEVIPKFFLKVLNNQSPIVYGNGKQTRDFTYVSDTVSGIIKAGEKQSVVGEIVNVAYGQEISINKLATLVYKVCGQTGKPTHKSSRPADVKRLFADTQKAEKLLSFSAQIPIETGLKKYLRWLKTSKLDLSKAIMLTTEENWK